MAERKKITKEEIDRICELYEDGLSVSEMVKVTNIKQKIIYEILRKNDFKLTRIHGRIAKEIIDKYLQGQNIKQLSDEYNFKDSTISKFLKNNNIEIRKEKFNEEEKNNICLDYQNGLSEKKVGEKYNTYPRTIRKILKEKGVTIRNQTETSRKHKLNEMYFDNLNSPNKAYILGFLYADGNVGKKKYSISLSLQENDIAILEAIKQEIESEAPLYYRKFEKYNDKYGINTRNQWALVLHSKHMYTSLAKLGIVPNKTHQIVYPNFLEEDLHRHFIRGVLDGDGCIHKPYGNYNKIKSVDINGTKEFCQGLKNIVENVLGIHCSIIRTDKNRTTYRSVISGGNQVSKFLDWIYNEAELKLERKYNLYLKYYCKK